MRPGAIKLGVWWTLLLAATAFAQPRVVEAETRRLVFQVSPVPQSGDAAAQARQCLKSFRNAQIVKLRAFVVGSENAEPVKQAIEAEFKKRHQAAPLLSVIVVGALPHAGARVLIEAVALAKNAVNPGGVAFISGQPASEPQPNARVAPLVEKSLTALRLAHEGVGVAPADVLRATCFVTSLADLSEAERMARRAFPAAPLSFIQLQSRPARALVECETVARLRPAGKEAEKEPLRFVNPGRLAASPNYSHVALVGAQRLVFSDLVLAPGVQEADAKLAFRQLEQALAAGGASIKQAAMSHLYPTSPAASELIRNTRFGFYDKSRPPASTLLLFEALPGGAAFGVEVVAPKLSAVPE
jgi:enamine deaminase RidA (YjgF/YER057c/UK114 family)